MLLMSAFLLVISHAGHTHAQAPTDVLIEVELPRKQEGAPVYQRAVLMHPGRPADTALLFYRGGHGVAMIKSSEDGRKNLPRHLGPTRRLFSETGIAVVVMDCPTDQWGEIFGRDPTKCLDDYRSSTQHADDARAIIAKLKNGHGISKIHITGHSKGALSSRWLAVHLGNEINGSIHTGAMTYPSPRGYGTSASRIPYASISAPVLHIHHKDDSCRVTPISGLERYAKNNLTTVRGGDGIGDPCGGGHYHSFQGREEAVAKAMVNWIKTGKVEPFVGE